MKTTMLEYAKSLKAKDPYAPIPLLMMSVGELVDMLEELETLRAEAEKLSAYSDNRRDALACARHGGEGL